MKIEKMQICSMILGLYILAIFLYYLHEGLRMLLFPLLLVLSFLSLKYSDIPKKVFNAGTILFFIVIVIQVFQQRYNLFALYIPASFCFGYFVYRNTFNIKILYILLLLFSAYFLLIFILKGNLSYAFGGVSANYVSVIMIMYSSLITMIIYRQKKRIIVFPFFLAFFFSLLAVGRAGILCSLFLFSCSFWYKLREQSRKVKFFSFLFLFIPLSIFIYINVDKIFLMYDNMDLLYKFSEGGIESPARRILIREYMSHIDVKNFFLGYDYSYNDWFKHYGLNPHNSYIRLHHHVGVLSFVILGFILYAIIRLFTKNKFLLAILVMILLRASTDAFFFLSFFDFILVYIFLLLTNTFDLKHNIVNKNE